MEPQHSPRAFKMPRQKRGAMTKAEVRRMMEDLRPDFSTARTAPSGTVEQASKRMISLGYLGEAIKDTMQAVLEVALMAGYEKMYREAHRDGSPDGKRLDQVKDAVAIQQIADVGALAAVGLLLRMIRTTQNPGTDTASDRVDLAPVIRERLAYFHRSLPYLTESINSIDALTATILPELPDYLDRCDALFLEAASEELEETTDAQEARAGLRLLQAIFGGGTFPEDSDQDAPGDKNSGEC